MLLPARVRHALVAVLLITAGAVVASAQDAPQDPPGRVARLNYISGQVSFRPASLEDWGTANVNYPLTTGDHLWTERSARAELQLGPSVIRLASETAFAFLDLDDEVVQARVAEGSVYVRVRELGQHETYEIDTPNAAVSIVRPGIYRIDVQPDGTLTRVTVRTGLAEVNGADGAFSVDAGDSAEIAGTDEMTYDIGRAPSPDTWERWCTGRDQREDDRPALRYVSSSMVGYEDLDDYGSWSYEPDYGYAWTPTVVAMDWAPYRYGHWSWVQPWGWTWVDDARWGFAPFHYGRWAHHRDHWMWIPGHYVTHPVYAPALVGFVGGLDWSFTFNLFGRPAVGWFPLGPGEVYCPSYHVSPAYVHNVNATHVNVTNINVATYDVSRAHYNNRAVPGAITAVPREVFVGAQSVQRAAVAVPRESLEKAPVVGHAIALAPDTRSIVGHSTPSVPRPPLSATRRPVIARTQPPAQALRDTPVVSLDARSRLRGNGRPAAADSQPNAIAPRAVDAGNGAARSRASANATRPNDVPSQNAQPVTAGSSNWRPSVRGRDVPAARGDANAQSSPRSGSTSPTPRYDGPRYETPRYEPPRYEAPRFEPPRYTRPAEPNRAASARANANEGQPVHGRDQAPSRGTAASDRGETPSRNSEPSRGESTRERPSTPSADRPSAPSSTARPAEGGGERRPPASSTGRGGQSSEGAAKPRGRG